jgi:multiple sugar transport system substrate-binding protein
MTRRWFVLLAAFALMAAACTGPAASIAPSRAPATLAPATAATPAPATAAATPAASAAESMGAESPAASEEASPGESPAETSGASPAGTPAGGAFDPSTVTGNATLGQWESSPAERDALAGALGQFREAYPDLLVDQLTVAGNYRDQMVTRFGAHTPPDVFYVNAEYAQDWINQGFLLPLDDYIQRQGFDTSTFYPDFLNIFTGTDGQIYGLPKDGNTIALAYNTDLVTTPPTTMDELMTMAQTLKDNGDVATPMCLNPGLDRGLAFIYAQGGELLNADGTAEAISTDASKAAVQWYLDLFKNGLGAVAPTGSWCGQELGSGNVAMAFEGGWLIGFMNDTFPETPYAWAEMPVGSSGAPVTLSYTAAYSIGVDSANKDQGWAVEQWLTGPDGMEAWTSGGIAAPSRSDVPAPEGFDAIVKGAEYSRPGSGFMNHYGDVQDAFTTAFTLEIQNGTYSADPVVAATAAAITTALSQ